jgi:hypothetical protein
MITVKDAAAALGVDERTIREKLSNGEWKGEKQLVGLKEKWFMYHGEFERQVERLRALRAGRTRLDGVDEVFAVETSRVESDVVDSSNAIEDAYEAPPNTAGFEALALEKLWSQIETRFLDRLEGKDQLIGELRSELVEKDRQLKLLPDFEAIAERERKARSEREFEVEALKKQISILESENESQIQAQLQSLKEQKDAELQAAQEKIEELSNATVPKQPQSFWKKWFLPRES